MAREKKKDSDGKTARESGFGGNLGLEVQLFLAAGQLRKNLEPSGNRHVALGLFAHELVTVSEGNATVDWRHRGAARANVRRHVRRLLRMYDYPADLQGVGPQNVLQRAEALSPEWAA